LLAKGGSIYSREDVQDNTREIQGREEVVTEIAGSGRVSMDETLRKRQKKIWIRLIPNINERERTRMSPTAANWRIAKSGEYKKREIQHQERLIKELPRAACIEGPELC
jgi:hypothetical protein